jgi:ribosomal protein S27AE
MNRLTDDVTGRATILGHPSVSVERESAPAVQIALCAGCGGMHTILMLSHDRWFCTRCRNAGDARPRQFFFKNPERG